MTNKDRIRDFDALKARADKLELALYDLACSTRFPFRGHVKVDVAKEIDGNQGYDQRFRVSVSDRANPVYMVECYTDRQVTRVEFWQESELIEHVQDSGIFWRMLRHAAWKIKQAERKRALTDYATPDDADSGIDPAKLQFDRMTEDTPVG